MQAVDRLGREADGAVEPERAVRADDIVVDCLGHTNQWDAAFEELVGDRQRPIATDRHEGIELQLMEPVDAVSRVILFPIRLVRRIRERVTTVGRAEDGTAMAQDAGDVSRRQHPHAVGVDQPVEAVLETHTLAAVVARRLHHRADHRVETGCIPAAGQDTDACDGRHLSDPSLAVRGDPAPRAPMPGSSGARRLRRLQPAVYNDCLRGAQSAHASRLPPRGPLAQLGERRVRNAEVVGSSPMRSTNYNSGSISACRRLANGQPFSPSDSGRTSI